MDAIKRIIFRLMEALHRQKRAVLALSCLVVFITTYVLILPAFTLEKDEAARQGGIDVPSVETTAKSGLADGVVPEAVSDEEDMSAADGDIQNAGDAYSSGETLADDDADIEDDGADMSASDGDTEIPDDADENTDDADAEDENASADSDAVAISGSDAETGEAADDAAAEDEAAEPQDDAEAVADSDAQDEDTEAQSADPLTFEGDGFTVSVDDTHSVLPADTQLAVEELLDNPTEGTKAERKEQMEAYKAYCDQAIAAINEESKDKTTRTISFAKLYDISLQSSGEEISPDKPVDVTISYDKKARKDLKVDEAADVRIIHFAQDEKTDEVTAELIDEDAVDVTLEKSRMAETTFEAESFSVYAVIYTVDFHYEVNGEKYDYSFGGGETDSLRNIIDKLHVYETVDKDVADNLGAELTAETFLQDVEKVEFSDEDLVKVARITEDTTAGELNKSLDIEPEYSAELTEEDIRELESRALTAPDWALISLKPFDTEETLTVTMKNGDVFEIKVTDDQLHTFVISDSGDTYEIIVTYDDSAEIPENAELKVSEIADDSSEYAELCASMEEALGEKEEAHAAIPAVFDISIVCDGKKIEPKEGSKVQVEAKLVRNAYSSLFDEDKTPFLINDEPIAADDCLVDTKLHVLHEKASGDIEVVDTEEKLSATEATSLFTTDSFSDWLLYLDEDLTSITIGVEDTLTLRPYGEWYWIKNTEGNPYQEDYWKFDSNTWSSTPDGNITKYSLNNYQSDVEGAKVEFKSYTKTDGELDNEQYTVIYGHATAPGTFWIETQGGKRIQVNVVDDVRDVPPVITNTANIKVNLFNYDNTENHVLDDTNNTIWNITYRNWFNDNVNVGHDLKFLGWGSGAEDASWGINQYTKSTARQGIVQNTLTADHYPQLDSSHSNQSLKYLFDTSSNSEAVKGYADVDGLFQLDENGYYYYNSNSNYAWFDERQNRFVLYSHTYSQETRGSYSDYGTAVNAKPIGFFPFHRYDDPVADENHSGMNYNPLLDHHFGMSMEVEFSLPPGENGNGPVAPNGEHIIYEFSGDDDLWVFIDDDLVLDIGGIHQPVRGYIDFTTGDVYVYKKGHTTSQKVLNLGTSKHKLRMFYIERGGCDSNLSVKFNLPLTVGNVSFTKTDEGQGAAAKALRGAVFGLYSDPECTKLVAYGTSSEDGVVEFKGYAPGTYYMKETTAPHGYVLDSSTKYKVSIVDENDTSHSSTIVKLNASGEEIPGNITKITNPKDETQAKVKKNWVGDQSRIPSDAAVTVTLGRYKLVPEGQGGEEPAQTGTILINQFLADDGAQSHASDFKVDYIVKNATGETVAQGSYTGTTGATITGLEPGTYSIESTCSSQNTGYYVGNEEQNRSNITVAANGSATVSFSNTLTSIPAVSYNVKVISKDNDNSDNGDGNWPSASYPEGTRLRLDWKWLKDNNWGQRTHCQYNIGNGWQTFSDSQWDSAQNSWHIDIGPLSANTTIKLRNTDDNWHAGYDWLATPTLTVIEPDSTSSSPLNLNRQNAVMLRGATPVRASASNPTPPEGYTIDENSADVSGWSKEITLPDGASWERNATGLEKVDIDGNIYVYYIKSVTETGMPEGTTVSIDLDGENKQVVFGNQTETGTLSVTNTIPVGSLALEKFVRVNEFDPDTSDVLAADKSKANGEYIFNVVGKPDTATAGQSYEVKITIGNKTVSGTTHYGVPTSAMVNGETVELTEDGRVVIPDMIPGEYTITEADHEGTICLAVTCSDNAAVTDIDSASASVVVPADEVGATPKLVAFTNNYADDSAEDVAHLSVRKTFSGLSPDQIPGDFKVNVKVTLSTGEVKTYTLTGSPTQPSGITFKSTSSGNSTIWNWKIAIAGLNPQAIAEVTEVSYEKPGYGVTTTVNGAEGVTASGSVSSSTVVQSLVLVEPAQNSKIFDVYTNDQSASVFIARVPPTQTALVISKHKLNLSERAALEEQLKHMPQAQDWTNGQPVQYYSFEDAENNRITARSMPVTYRDKGDGTGEIEFFGKKQWNMASTVTLNYVPGRPADFNFVNDYSEQEIDLNIIKVDKDTPANKLPGAKFRITLLDEELTTSENVVTKTTEGTPVFSREFGPTDGDGKVTLTGLMSGFYKVEESQSPAGYVISEQDPTFYVHVIDGTIVYMIRSTEAADKDKTLDQWATSDTGSGLVGYNKDTKTATVQNEPGVELPHTGGIGTMLFYIFGSMLVIGCGALLIARRRVHMDE